MGIIIDLVIIAILILSVFLGYKKGLVNVVFNICAFLVAIIATIILYKPVSNFIINNTDIYDKIRTTIIGKYGETATNSNEENSFGLTKYITQKIEDAASETKEKAVEAIADEIALKVIQVVAGIGLFIVIRIALIVLKFLSEGLAELPLIKQINKAGGTLYGLGRALIIIYILLNILFIVASISKNGKIQEAIDNSYVAKFVFEHNLILK